MCCFKIKLYLVKPKIKKVGEKTLLKYIIQQVFAKYYLLMLKAFINMTFRISIQKT